MATGATGTTLTKASSVALSQITKKRTNAPIGEYKVLAKPEIMSFQTILSKLDYETKAIAAEFLIYLNTAELNVVTVESLTAGKIASTLADIPSYANCIYGGFVVYDSDAKREFVDVTVKSVYNQKCAKQMAEGALKKSRAMCALAVTGQAGGYDDTDETYLGYVDAAFSVRNINSLEEMVFNTYTKRIKFCNDKYIKNSCDEYKKRLKILHTNKACPDLGTLPLSDDLYQIRQIIRTACVRDALLFAYNCMSENNIDNKFTEKLNDKIFDITERDIKLKDCDEPSKFIKKYMKGDKSVFENSKYANSKENLGAKKTAKLFGKSNNNANTSVESGSNNNTNYNDYCDQKDWNETTQVPVGTSAIGGNRKIKHKKTQKRQHKYN